MYRDFVSNVTIALSMRTDQAPFNDVRVRRALSHAIDRQSIIEAVYIRGEQTSAIARGATEWSLPVDQLGAGAKYYQYDPKEAKRLLSEAGCAKGLKTQLNTTPGYGRALMDAVQLVQRNLKDVGIEAELKSQEYGASMATTFAGTYDGLALGPIAHTWEPDSSPYDLYVPGQARHSGHVNDPKITAMLQGQRHLKDLAARKQVLFDFQRYGADQQYDVYLLSIMNTAFWQPYVKHYAPNMTDDYGGRVAALWLERSRPCNAAVTPLKARRGHKGRQLEFVRPTG